MTAPLLFVVSMLVSAPAFAQDESFKDGMKAFDGKRWAEVAKHMRAAIAARPQESTRMVEYGGVIGLRQKNVEYLPHFYLGQALFNMQDCAGAVDAWATSEKQAAVKANQQFNAIIQGGYSVCEQKGVLPPRTYDPLAARAQQQYADVSSLAGSISALGQKNLEQWRPEMKEQYERAVEDLETFRTRFAIGARTRAEKDFADATAAAERARVTLVRLDASLRAAVDGATKAQGLVRETEQALAAAEADDRQIDTRLSGRAALTDSLAATRKEARDGLSRGRALYSSGSKGSNATQLTEARGLARQAAAKFRQVLDEVSRFATGSREQQLAEARAGAAQAARLVDVLFVTLDKRMAANPSLAAQVAADHQAVRKQSEALRRNLESASKGDNLPAIVQTTRQTVEMRARLSELTAKFGPIALRERGVSQALEEGSAQFFAGRYQQALDLLNPSGGLAPDDPLRLHIHLFRAASLFALYGQSRETKQDLRAQALAEVEACRKIDSTFQPDPRAFSPRFISFFQGGQAAEDPSVASARQ